MAPPRSSTPQSEDGEAKPPRAFVRQCVFYEKYGGCKFGKDCFYAHNDEMTLGVRNAMQMAQAMGRGGVGGGVEIRYDEREKEVKMVRIENDKHKSRDDSNENSAFGKFDRFANSNSYAGGGTFTGRGGRVFGGRGGGYNGGMGRGRFNGNRGIFRGTMRGRGQNGHNRYISPVRSSGNIFAEEREHRKRKSKKGHHHHHRSSRSSTPHKRSRRSTISASSHEKEGGSHKNSRNSSRSSIRNKSRSKSLSRSSSWHSNSPHSGNKKKHKRRGSDSPTDPTRMELRSLSKNLAREKYLKAKNDERKSFHHHQHHQHHYSHKNIHKIKYSINKKEERKEGETVGKSSSKRKRHCRSSSSSTYSSVHSHKSAKDESPKSPSPTIVMNEDNENIKKLEEDEENFQNIKEQKEECYSIIDENIELVYEDYREVEEQKSDEERHRLELIEQLDKKQQKDCKNIQDDIKSVTSNQEFIKLNDSLEQQSLKAIKSCFRRPSSR